MCVIGEPRWEQCKECVRLVMWVAVGTLLSIIVSAEPVRSEPRPAYADVVPLTISWTRLLPYLA